ncbi:unnamed protein product [Bathycoccus prasinos]
MRTPIESLTEDEFLRDLIAHLQTMPEKAKLVPPGVV